MIINILFQFLYLILFFVAIFIGITLPGFLLLKKIKLAYNDKLKDLTIASCLGLVIFTLAAYILAAVHLRFLMYIFFILGTWAAISMREDLLKIRFNIHYKKFFLIVLILGILGQVAINAPSGFPYQDGIYFWSSQGHDGVWHLSLMEQMHANDFPFKNPELEGAKLQNYHFFVDLLMSEFSRLFPFSNLDIYFRFMPTFFSLMLGLSSFIFIKVWGKSELAAIWAMIFVYFAGSFGYLLYIPTHKSLGGEAIFWVSQTQSVLGNPPHAVAFIITTVFLFSFLQYLNSRKFGYFLLCSILGGAVIEFKVYAGVLILGGLMIVSLYELIFKRSVKVLLLFLTTLFISLLIYLPNSANTQDFLIWQPWWFIRTMVVAPDRLNWLDLELRRQTYLSEGNFKRVIQVEAIAFFIFLFGNLGMRFIGFWGIFKQFKENIFERPFNLFFFSITIASFFIPVFFLQKGVVWNVIQFNQYFLLYFSFYASLAVPGILNSAKSIFWKYSISTIIIILAIPTQLGLLWQFYSNLPLSKITYEEISALNFLKSVSNKEDVILSGPFSKYEKDKYKNPPIPIYAWYDTAYISAFSSRKSLISDEEQLTIMGYDISKLLKDREEAFRSSDNKIVNGFLKKYKVKFIYLVWDQKFATDSAYLNADIIFKNKDAKIYKVKNE